MERMCVTMLDFRLGDELLFETPVAFLLQTDLWDMIQHSGPALMAVMVFRSVLGLFLDHYLL